MRAEEERRMTKDLSEEEEQREGRETDQQTKRADRSSRKVMMGLHGDVWTGDPHS